MSKRLEEVRNILSGGREGAAEAASSASDSSRMNEVRKYTKLIPQKQLEVKLKPQIEAETGVRNQISGEIAARAAGAGDTSKTGTAAHMIKISGLQAQEAELKLNQTKTKLDAVKQKEAALAEQNKMLASAQQGMQQLMAQYQMTGDEVTGNAYLLAAEEYNKMLDQYNSDYAEYEKQASVYDEYNSALLKYQKAYAAYEKNVNSYQEEQEYQERLRHVEELEQNRSVEDLQRKSGEVSAQLDELYTQREILMGSMTSRVMTEEQAARQQELENQISELTKQQQELENRIAVKTSENWMQKQIEEIREEGGEDLLVKLRAAAGNPRRSQELADELYAQGYSEDQVRAWMDYAQMLNERQAYQAGLEGKKEYAKEHSGAASVASVPLNLAGGIGAVSMWGQKAENLLFGKETPLNYQNRLMLPGAIAREYRSGVSERIEEDTAGKAGSDTVFGNLYSGAYNLGMSMLDSLGVLGLTALGVPPAAASSLLGGAAATSSMQDALERGATEDQALLFGTISGIAEMFFEKYSIDNLIKMDSPKTLAQALKNTGLQGLVEASEEGATTLANTAADLMFLGDRSELLTKKQEYIDMGYSEQEAEKMARNEWLAGLGADLIGGFISGGVFGGVGGTIDLARNKAAAKKSTTDQVNTDASESTVTQKPTDNKTAAPAEGIQWAGNQTGGIENVGTEQTDGASADRSTGREDVLDAEGGGAGKSAEWAAELERRRTAGREIESVVKDLRKRGRLSTTSSAALGVIGGSESDRVGVIRQSDETEQLRQIRNRNAEMGLDTVFVTDRLSVNIGTGTMTVSGVHEKGRVVLQVNATDYTVDELADHELYHEMARQDPELVSRTREALKTNYSEEELDALFRHYMNIYSRAYQDREGMTQEALEEKVYEEMLADAFARHRTSGAIDASVLSESVRTQAAGQTEQMAQTEIEEQAKRDAAAETINEEAIKTPSDIGSIQQDPEFLQLKKDLQEGVIDRREYEKELAEYIDRLSDQKSSEEYEDEKDQRFALEGYEEELPQILDAGIRQAATMEPVRAMTGEEFKKGEKDLTEQVTEFFEGTGNKAVHPILGEVTLNRRGVKDDIAHGIGRNKAITFTAVPDVIEKGGLIDYQENWKERGYDTAVVAAPVTIVEKPYMMGVVLMRENGGNRFYVHEALAESEEGTSPFKTGTAKGGTSGGDAPSIISLLQRVLDVKKSEQSFAASNETGEDAETTEDAAPGDELTNEIRHTAGGVESYVLAMPAKAKKAWNMKKRAAVRNFARGLWTKATPEFNDVVDNLANEYLETGTISKDNINQAFKDLYRFAPESKAKRETVKREFTANINILKSDLADVRRYLGARAETTEQARNKVEESLSVEEIWKTAKMQKREIYRVESRTLLTDFDKMVVGQLLRGEIYPHQIPKRADRKAVMEVYEARNQYETTMKWLRHHKKVHDAMVTSQVMDVIGNFPDWKDYKRGLPIKISTMERVFRKIAPSEEIADKAIKELLTPVHEAVADTNRLKNSIRRRVMALKLSRKAEKGKLSEAAAVQLLGEAEENIEQLKKQPAGEMRDGKTLEEWQAEITNLWENNPQLNEEKIRNAVSVFHEIYDMLFRMANDARIRNGYEPVDYRKGYFPHFMNGKPDGLVAQLGKMLGVGNDVTALPTAINGLTKNFKPGKKFFGHELQRKTGETTLDAVEGLDRYLEGVADVIYLTDAIKRLRAFASAIRHLSTEDGIKEQIRRVKKMDIPKEEKQRRISEIRQKSPTTMSVFVAQLDEYINQLAGKQSEADRPIESALGRGAYNALKWVESRIAVNMVGLNPGSWTTNILPLALAQASIRTDYIARGIWDTIVNRVQTASNGNFDGFEDQSTFLVNRKGSDRMVKTPAQRVTARLTAGMEIIDYFIAESLTRARVYQNKAQGMSDYSALKEADAWIPAIMADRSKGATPTMFNEKNPLSKLLTMFQLEQYNQFLHLFKDLPREKRRKTAWTMFINCLLSTISAYILNDLLEHILGRRPGLDPLGMINEALGATTGFEVPNVFEAISGKDRDWKDEKKPFSEAGKEIFLDAMEQVPFVGGLIGGGRLPISAALPDFNALWNAVSMATDDPETEETEGWTADRKRNTIIKELLDPAAYLLPPVGGGQAKKILETAAAIYGHGSYNSSGNLQYPVFRGDWNTWTGGFIFGKSSLDTGVEWVDSGFKGLNEKYTAAYLEMIELGESDRASWDILKAMRDAEGEDLAAERRRILQEAAISGEAKYAVYYGVLASDKEKETMDVLGDADPEDVYEVMTGMKDQDNAGDKQLILRSALTEEEKSILFAGKAEKENARLQAASEYVDSFLYADYLETYKELYPDEDALPKSGKPGYMSKSERVQAAINSMDDLSRQEKAALWEIVNYTKGDEAKSNPYDKTVAREMIKIIESLYEEIDAAEQAEEEETGLEWAGR